MTENAGTDARAVSLALIEVLQAGLDGGDADHYDSWFAQDVLWGSPHGQVLRGFAPLNAVHRSQMSTPKPGHSRYELVQATAPAEGVVVAHVRRRTIDPSAGEGPAFSEMALYVLIERDGRWWLVAGQNTPVREHY